MEEHLRQKSILEYILRSELYTVYRTPKVVETLVNVVNRVSLNMNVSGILSTPTINTFNESFIDKPHVLPFLLNVDLRLRLTLGNTAYQDILMQISDAYEETSNTSLGSQQDLEGILVNHQHEEMLLNNKWLSTLAYISTMKPNIERTT